MADNLMIYKYVVKNTARRNGMTATFMPKPLFEDNASGMHVHQSLWKGETNLFYDRGDYAELSHLARHYIGGLLPHAWPLCGLCAPTTNSYRRLVPGYEAPITNPIGALMSPKVYDWIEDENTCLFLEVDHPGVAPRPFMRPAIVRKHPEIRQRLNVAIKALLLRGGKTVEVIE